MPNEEDEFDLDYDGGMEMPTPCQKCGKLFDLNDGASSQKWFPGTVICDPCGDIEQEEIERDDEIEDLRERISDAESTLNECNKRLKEMGEEYSTIFMISV